ncbi:MAG: YggS family pyridoxal phosphate-dependent enzyme [Ignavibacteriaceae bacterium]
MIADNVRILKERIEKKCAEIKRHPSELKIVAVSKFFDTSAIKEAFNAGITDFGENKAQELKSKYEILGDSVNWHFVGTLQKNKAKYVVKAASLIHSVDSASLAAEINKRAGQAGKIQNILIEYKTSYEQSKAGVSDRNELFKLVDFCSELENVRLKGLMTIAPFTDDSELIRNAFRELRELKNMLNENGFPLTELSMGMTGDFEIAIEEGATILRIGTAIFGQRVYSKDRKE